MRRLPIVLALVLSSSLLAPVHAATPDAGSVKPPSGKAKDGPALTWVGASFVVAANTGGTCAAVDPSQACDTFHLTVPLKPSYWKTRSGGVVVHIDGYDANQDFDMVIYEESADGAAGKRVGSSGRAAGEPEDATIKDASGKYMVVIYAYQVVNSSYKGKAFVHTAPLEKKTPPKVAIRGMTTARASHDKFTSHSEPTIAMNPLNHLNLIAGSKMYPDVANYLFKIGTYYSMDGGKTWKDNGQLPGYPNDDVSYITSDISMAFDDEGNAYAFVLDAGGGGMSVSISKNGGKSWGDPIAVHRNPNDPAGAINSLPVGFFDDKNWIVVDNTGPDKDGTIGTIYTCWNLDFISTAENDTVVASRSTDGGQTWSQPFPLMAPPSDSVIGCQVIVAPNGDAYVFWMDYGHSSPAGSEGEKEQEGRGVALGRRPRVAGVPAPPQLFYSKSTNKGMTWSVGKAFVDVDAPPGRLPGSTFRNPIFPTVGVGPDGTISVAWGDYRNGDEDILLVQSTDGAATWSDPVRVNDDKVGNHKDQFQPWLDVTPKGQINVFFFDRRNDPKNYWIDAYIARSNDGKKWKNVRVTPTMWDAGINAPLNGGFIGDYQGIVADDNAAIPFWNDTRTGRWQEVYSARVPNTPAYGGPAKRR